MNNAISCDEVTQYSQVARSLVMYPSNQLLFFASCAVAAVIHLDSCIPVCLGLGEYDSLLDNGKTQKHSIAIFYSVVVTALHLHLYADQKHSLFGPVPLASF